MFYIQHEDVHGVLPVAHIIRNADTSYTRFYSKLTILAVTDSASATQDWFYIKVSTHAGDEQFR